MACFEKIYKGSQMAFPMWRSPSGRPRVGTSWPAGWEPEMVIWHVLNIICIKGSQVASLPRGETPISHTPTSTVTMCRTKGSTREIRQFRKPCFENPLASQGMSKNVCHLTHWVHVTNFTQVSKDPSANVRSEGIHRFRCWRAINFDIKIFEATRWFSAEL